MTLEDEYQLPSRLVENSVMSGMTVPVLLPYYTQRRRALFQALVDRGLITMQRADEIINCEAMLKDHEIISINAKGDKRVTYTKCSSPLCERCNALKRQKFFKEYIDVIRQFRYPKLMTITFKNVPAIDQAYSKKCSQAANLVQKYLARQGYAIGMGIRVKETTYSAKGHVYRYWNRKTRKLAKVQVLQDGWHVHYHYIIATESGGIIPVDEVSKALSAATHGESFIVDIRTADDYRSFKNVKDRLAYCLKYLGKMPHLDSVESQVEYYSATLTTHAFQPVGSWTRSDDTGVSLYQKYMVLADIPFKKEWEAIKVGRYFTDYTMYDVIIKPRIVDDRLSYEENLIINQSTVPEEPPPRGTSLLYSSPVIYDF